MKTPKNARVHSLGPLKSQGARCEYDITKQLTGNSAHVPSLAHSGELSNGGRFLVSYNKANFA